MSDLVAPCPLCGATFEHDAAYTAHLADEHGLVDDEGTETTVEHALVVSGLAADKELAEAAAEAAAASKSEVAGPAEPTLHPSRVYDPNQDDHRYRPLAIGLAGVALLAFIGVGAATTFGGGGGGTARTAEVAVTSVDLGAGATAAKPGVLTAGGDAASPPADVAAGIAAEPDPAAPPGAPPATEPSAGPASAAPVPAPPASTAPPVTAAPELDPPPAPSFAAPSVSGARVDRCERSGRDATWTFSYVLSGGAAWAAAPTATPLGGGRYQEQRAGRESDGFPSTTIDVVDTTTGQTRSLTLSPSLAGQRCR